MKYSGTSNYSIKNALKGLKEQELRTDYPIQRAGGQWNELQKSLLIRSLLSTYPVPSLYAVTQHEADENGTLKAVKYILDGKQRLTNIQEFVEGGMILHEDTPPVITGDEDVVIASKSFKELTEEQQEKIKDFTLNVFEITEATDEELEDLFFVLNNGTPLSKQQMAKPKMGLAWAKRLDELVKHPLMAKAGFTDSQLKKAENETALLQTMMLLDKNHELKSISSNDVFEYAQTLREDSKNEVVEQMVKAMDYLAEAFKNDEKESVLLKKVHFPMTILTALKAMEMNVYEGRFADWRVTFKQAIKPKTKDSLGLRYKDQGGAGSVKGYKALNRIKYMQEHLLEYFKKHSPLSTEEHTTETPVVTTKPVEETKPSEFSEVNAVPKVLTKAEKAKLKREEAKRKKEQEKLEEETGSKLEQLLGEKKSDGVTV